MAQTDADEVERLRAENASLRAALSALRLEARRGDAACAEGSSAPPDAAPAARGWVTPTPHGLSSSQLRRFARHTTLPSFGVAAQGRLCASRALVVGLGGLGSPVALYLAAAGVGALTLADGDAVDISNLQRQVIHSEGSLGEAKSASAARRLRALNSGCRVSTHGRVTPAEAVALVARHDVVLDCSDAPATRYLLSDACAAARVPLVSGAALGVEGQVMVLCRVGSGGGSDAGPCLRCVYPRPPPPAAAGRCADAGVLGPVCGVVGCLQAVEAVKLLGGVCSGTTERTAGTLLLYDALSPSPFYAATLPPRRPGCLACGDGEAAPNGGGGGESGGARESASPSLVVGSPLDDDYADDGFAAQAASPRHRTAASRSRTIASTDYDAFARGTADRCEAEPAVMYPLVPRITAREYADLAASCAPHALIDVRPASLFEAATLPGASSMPFAAGGDAPALAAAFRARFGATPPNRVIVICRRGNASRFAAAALIDAGVRGVCDVAGGLAEWARTVDPDFPSIV